MLIPSIEARITWKGKSADARAAVCFAFDALPRRVHGRRDIEILLKRHRREWRLLATTTTSQLIDYLQTLHLSVIHLAGPDHNQERVRYGWRAPSVFDVAQSLQKNAYISHRSAAFLHGLIQDSGPQIYVNIEQSPKPRSESRLSQSGIDQAFKNKQRESIFRYLFQEWSITVLNGKNTGRLGVERSQGPSGGAAKLGYSANKRNYHVGAGNWIREHRGI